MDGREEVERTVHFCARKIELLPHGLKQKSLQPLPADGVHAIPSQKMADVPLRNQLPGGRLLVQIQLGSRSFMYPPPSEWLRYIRYGISKSHPRHQIVVYGKPILRIGRISADLVNRTAPHHESGMKESGTPEEIPPELYVIVFYGPMRQEDAGFVDKATT